MTFISHLPATQRRYWLHLRGWAPACRGPPIRRTDRWRSDTTANCAASSVRRVRRCGAAPATSGTGSRHLFRGWCPAGADRRSSRPRPASWRPTPVRSTATTFGHIDAHVVQHGRLGRDRHRLCAGADDGERGPHGATSRSESCHIACNVATSSADKMSDSVRHCVPSTGASPRRSPPPGWSTRGAPPDRVPASVRPARAAHGPAAAHRRCRRAPCRGSSATPVVRHRPASAAQCRGAHSAAARSRCHSPASRRSRRATSIRSG